MEGQIHCYIVGSAVGLRGGNAESVMFLNKIQGLPISCYMLS